MGSRTGNPEWKDYPDTSTLVTAARLNAIEDAIDDSATASALDGFVTEAMLEEALESHSGASEATVRALEETVDAITTVTPSKNLVNPADATPDVRINTTNGSVINDVNYTTTAHLPVTVGQSYAVRGVGGYTWWDAAGTFLSGANISGHGATVITAPAGAATIRLNVHDAHWGQNTLQMEEGTVHTDYVPYGPTVALAPEVAGPLVAEVLDSLVVEPEKTTFAHRSRNLYNPADPDVMPGYTLSGSTPSASANYTVTGYIPITPGQEYTLSNPRNWAQYSAAKQGISGMSGADPAQGTNVVTAHPQAAYLRASFLTASYADTFQVEKGNVKTAYVPFGITIPLLLLPDGGDGGDGGDSGPVAPLTLSRTGQAFTITDSLDGKPLLVRGTLTSAARRNNNFNFATVTFDGVDVITAPDDVTPIRTQQGTLGANHGHPYVRSFANPDGKTTADLGSVWTDGAREYVLLAIEPDGRLVLGGDYTTAGDGTTSTAVVNPTGPLTHVSGATKTATIDHTTIASAQLYPSLFRMTTTLWVDGRPVTTDGTTPAHGVQVRESYEIADYASLYDRAKANVGVPLANLTGVAGAVLVENVYDFRPRGVCLVSTDLTELSPTALGASGFVQAGRLSPAGTVRNLPGVAPIGGHDFNAPAGVALDSYSTSLIVTTADLLVPGRPPTVAVDRVRSGSTTTLGFALGYLPHTGTATDMTARLATTPGNLWDLRSTDKNYPNAVKDVAPGWGHLKARAFRAYLTPADADTVATAGDALAAWSTLNARARLT